MYGCFSVSKAYRQSLDQSLFVLSSTELTQWSNTIQFALRGKRTGKGGSTPYFHSLSRVGFFLQKHMFPLCASKQTFIFEQSKN